MPQRAFEESSSLALLKEGKEKEKR